MHTQVLGVVTAVALGSVLLPATAQAESSHATLLPRVPATRSAGLTTGRSAGTAADQSALTAYHAYLGALNAAAGNSADRDALILNGVASGCRGALDNLTSLSASQLQTSALTEFADEVAADLDVAYMAATKPALAALNSGLTGLQWSTAAQDQVSVRLIRTEQALLATPQSNLCADATTLNAAPLSEPSATAQFMTRYRRTAANLRAAVTAFQKLLSKFEVKSERKLVAQINTLVSQFSAQSTSTEQADASTILSDLGINSTSSS